MGNFLRKCAKTEKDALSSILTIVKTIIRICYNDADIFTINVGPFISVGHGRSVARALDCQPRGPRYEDTCS